MRAQIRVVGVVWTVVQLAAAWPAAAQTPAPPPAPATKTVAIGPQYAGGGFKRLWFGDGYRDLWTTPVALTVLDLKTVGGGLTPVRVVGQAQSVGLALRGADGKAYTFRSLHKHPERMLPEVWRGLWPAKIAQDQTSGTHPGAALIQAAIAETVGVPFTAPQLVVMPDDPALGQFRAQFANEIGTIDLFPLAGPNGTAGYMGATEIISSEDLWKRMAADPAVRVDTKALLRARVVDLWVDNYDRHRGQWRWMKIPGQALWQPLPEDPDFVLVRHDGLVASIMRGRVPDYLKFSASFPSRMEGPLNNAFQVDRWLLTDLGAAEWEAVAREVASKLTDAAIESAIRRLPPEWAAKSGAWTSTALKSRRDRLVDYVMRAYEVEAKDVNVHATDRDETVTVARGANNDVVLSMTAAGASAPYYRRTFRPGETKEVRVHLHGGNDTFTRTGPSGGPITVRVVAGDGHDVVDDSASGGTDVWHDGASVEVKRGDGTKVRNFRWVNPDPVEGAPWIEPRSFGHLSIGAVIFGYAPDPGAIVGYEITRTAWGFRTKDDASSVQTLRGSIGAMDRSLLADYVGRFRATGTRFSFQFEAAAIETRRSNFFGFGNETANPEDRARFSTRQTIFFAAPSVRWEHGHRSELYLASEFQYSNARLPDASYLKKVSPIGAGTFGTVELKAGFRFDSRAAGEASAPSDLAAVSGFAEGREAVSGIRAEGNVFVAPKVWDVKATYQGGEGSLTGYVGSSRAHLAVRVGGRAVSGDYPWFESAFIGSHNNRGYYSHRFRGDRSLYGNTSLRLWTGAVPIIIPVRIGLIGFADTGRVWADGESSTVWHNTTGGGLMFRPLATNTTIYTVIGHSKEGNRFYFGFGFPF